MQYPSSQFVVHCTLDFAMVGIVAALVVLRFVHQRRSSLSMSRAIENCSIGVAAAMIVAWTGYAISVRVQYRKYQGGTVPVGTGNLVRYPRICLENQADAQTVLLVRWVLLRYCLVVDKACVSEHILSDCAQQIAGTDRARLWGLLHWSHHGGKHSDARPVVLPRRRQL